MNKAFHTLTLILFYIGFLNSPIYSQVQKEADSLINVLNGNEQLSDSAICLLKNEISFNSSDPSIQLKYAQEAYNLGADINDERQQALSKRYEAIAYRRIGNLTDAIKCFHQAAEHYSNVNLELGVGVVYMDIGSIYRSQENINLSKSYFHRGIRILREKKDSVRMASALLNLGELYRTNDQLDSANQLYSESEIIFKKSGHQIGWALAKGNKGMVLAAKGENLDQAKSEILDAIDILISNEYFDPVAEYQVTLADIAIANDNIQEAEGLLLNALKIATNGGLKEIIRDVSFELAKVYELEKNFKKAYELQGQYLAYRDSINNEEVIRQIADLRTSFEISQKQIEVDLLSEKNRNANFMLYGALFGIVLLLVVAIIIYRALILNKKLSLINKQQAERLRQLDEAKSRFFANISHDLRSPLTLIIGGINEVLQNQEVFLTKKAEKQLKTAQINSERIIHMTGEINELIQLEEGKLTLRKVYVDFDQMLRLFDQMFRSTAEQHQIRWSYFNSLSETQILVYIDPYQFEKVLFNLITNALKYTKPGDEINIRLTGDEQNLKLIVSDTGEGIPEEKLPHIFERYFQAPNKDYKAKEGFGIGLALVQEIIHQHDAKIEVESEIGKGSTFIVTLPYSTSTTDEIYQFTDLSYSDEKQALYKNIDEKIAESRHEISLDLTLNQSKIRSEQTILIVEDHPEVRAFIQDIISPFYHVLSAPNGLKALKILKNEKVDLIITDLMMPWLDGFELLERLRDEEQYSNLPVLVLSARTSEEDKTRVLSHGVNDFLCKPFKAEELVMRIDNLLKMKAAWSNDRKDALIINNQETLADIEKSLLKKIEQLILDRVDDPNLSIAYLADQIAVSERKFYRLIKKLTGMTPFELIKEVRLQLAHRMLKEKNIVNSSEIAKSIGIVNVTHFNTQFKKRFGQSPKELMGS